MKIEKFRCRRRLAEQQSPRADPGELWTFEPWNKSLNGQYHLSTYYNIRDSAAADCNPRVGRDNIRASASYAEAILFSNSTFFIEHDRRSIPSREYFSILPFIHHIAINYPIEMRGKKSFPISPSAQVSQLWEARALLLFISHAPKCNNSSRLRTAMHC